MLRRQKHASQIESTLLGLPMNKTYIADLMLMNTLITVYSTRRSNAPKLAFHDWSVHTLSLPLAKECKIVSAQKSTCMREIVARNLSTCGHNQEVCCHFVDIEYAGVKWCTRRVCYINISEEHGYNCLLGFLTDPRVPYIDWEFPTGGHTSYRRGRSQDTSKWRPFREWECVQCCKFLQCIGNSVIGQNAANDCPPIVHTDINPSELHKSSRRLYLCSRSAVFRQRWSHSWEHSSSWPQSCCNTWRHLSRSLSWQWSFQTVSLCILAMIHHSPSHWTLANGIVWLAYAQSLWVIALLPLWMPVWLCYLSQHSDFIYYKLQLSFTTW